MKKICQKCGRDFNGSKFIRKFCSMRCSQLSRNGQVKIKCVCCKKEFKTYKSEVVRGGGKYCSKKCYVKHDIKPKGKEHQSWLGGKFEHNGYVFIYIGYPATYVQEHRLVMEKYLKRKLQPKEVVHHINEVKNDNRIENLQLFKTTGEHMSYHKNLSVKI